MEKAIEKYLVSSVERLGGWCLKLAPIFNLGLPDRLVLLPHGRVVFVELKREGAKPTSLQTKIHNRLRRLGFHVEVLSSKGEVDAFTSPL